MDLAFGTATEDMDALTFGTNFLLRGFNSKKEPVCQIELAQVLEGFEMNHEEFIDLCILCGCDYTHSIGGMGPVTAFKLIKEHKTIESVMEMINAQNEDPERKKKYIIPEKFLYEESRELFKNPDCNRNREELEKHIVFDKPNEEELTSWLVGHKGFAEVKVTNGIERLRKCQGKKNQTRLDCFFKSTAISSSKKVEAPKGKAKGKGAKSGFRKTTS
jgi:flap endonuclease-1